MLWHNRLANAFFLIIKKALQNCNIQSNDDNALVCPTCQLGKFHKLPFSTFVFCVNEPLVVIHANFWVSFVVFKNGFHYYFHFTDEYSKFTWIFFLKAKDVFQVFLQFKSTIELKLAIKVKILQSDWSGEF